MKAHKYWSLGALLTMFGTFYTGYKGAKSSHKYFAVSSLIIHKIILYYFSDTADQTYNVPYYKKY